ncbi:tritrans,polycis-undecaprenyl-diphosphate synthase [geranylgeranyl-diphosphate specific] [Methanohalophilus levihalophilus]|uniref:polyprenyl diphosphate synthase n=1 Tax=Methanohalophilus levihalophilus TaxID=1431282 RepID=UPI001AE82AA8|nr:polyprenyl diphosphate synthase [Methanohalophilus levihalophilus]MBP2029265.1 tritrans,polycis-undecaprenyl-diphosphate synthase [geranylgeranyl-diphosphate specific] [Methanohalophilus levihalophilus]
MPNKLLELVYKGYEDFLIREIRKAPLPSHVAIIMDGNRRFAQKLGKMKHYGHRVGANITENVIEWAYDIGINELTVYAFSTENFHRPQSEKNSIFDLIKVKLEELCTDERTHQRELKVRVIGDRTLLPEDLLKSVRKVEQVTSGYNEFTLNVAIAYGGRQDLVQAIREIAKKVQKDEMEISELTDSTISQHLYPEKDAPVSDVDLIIRTGGDERLSNFLPWQASGNECATYFCAPYWPDFRKIDFLRSIRLYQQRTAEKEKLLSKRTHRLSCESHN